MPAPKGNQYAAGNPSGKAGAPPKYDLEAEGKELVEWSKISSSTSFYQFTRDKDYRYQKLFEFCQRSEVFKDCMERARENIGQNREEQMCDGLLHPRAWERWAPVYHKALDEYEDSLEDRKHQRALAKIDYEIKKKNEIQSTVSEDIVSQFSELMNQITSLQKKD